MAYDPTVGGASADSFLTTAEGDAFAALRLDAATWTAATDANKQAALVTASYDANQLCLTGSKTSATQALNVPRTGWTEGGQAIDPDTIPRSWKYMVFEWALLLLQTTGTARLTPDAITEGLSKLKAGSVELQWRSDFEFREIPPHVRRLIPAEWLCVDDAVYLELEVV